ncbi:MAG: hypothetical protein V1777_05105 [Candidatus Micrarchaeota archaeon]
MPKRVQRKTHPIRHWNKTPGGFNPAIHIEQRRRLPIATGVIKEHGSQVRFFELDDKRYHEGFKNDYLGNRQQTRGGPKDLLGFAGSTRLIADRRQSPFEYKPRRKKKI